MIPASLAASKQKAHHTLVLTMSIYAIIYNLLETHFFFFKGYSYVINRILNDDMSVISGRRGDFIVQEETFS